MTDLLSLSLVISCRSPSFLSISVFSLVGHSLLSLSLTGNDSIFFDRKWPHPSPVNPFPHRDCPCHSDRQWHQCKVHNTESPNYFFSTIFFIHAIISLLDCLWQILDCLWNVCVFAEFFFFILIFVFGCRESTKKMPRNTSLTVILLRAKWSFSSFNPRLLVSCSQQYLPKY